MVEETRTMMLQHVTPRHGTVCSMPTLFKPVSKYSYAAHNYRSSPWLQIYNARHMKIDTTEYQSNRTYYSKLYTSMKTAGIPHQDILAVYGNPYIGVATKWYSLGNKRWNVIEKEYPWVWSVAYDIDKVKSDFANVFSKTTPVVRQFVNEFAIPIATMRTGAPSRLKQVAEKVSEYLYEIADGFNRAMIPGYAAYADGGSVEEIVTSAGSDLILTYCGGKAIKIGWKASKGISAKFSSVLKSKTMKVTWGLWEDLPKATYKGKEYAKIGKYYYSYHAVEHMMPANVALELGLPKGVARNIPSSVPRYLYSYDDVTVVTDITSKVIISLGKRTK